MSLIVSSTNSPHRIYAGQTEIGDVVVNGGELVVMPGGTAADLTVSNGGVAFVRAGGELEVTSGSSSDIDGYLVNRSTVTVGNDGTLTINGAVKNEAALYASAAGSLIDINGVVNGGVAVVGNGTVEIGGSSGEGVKFLSNGTGGLVLDGTGNAYTGKVDGFGVAGGGNSNQSIDFAGVNYAGAIVSYTPANAADTSGTLTVTDGTHSASIVLVGQYEASDFQNANNGGTLEITDNTTIYATAYTNKGNIVATSASNAIFLSSLTNNATVDATSGGTITVEGVSINFGNIETGPTPGEINFESTVTNNTNIYASAGAISVKGQFTNGGALEAIYDAAIDLGSNLINSFVIFTNSNATLTQTGGYVSNTDEISAFSQSQIALGGSYLNNFGLVQGTGQSTFTMSFTGGILNDGRIEADNQAYVAVGGSSSFVNNGAVAVTGSAMVQINMSATNYGTMVASGGAINFAQSLYNTGALLVEGTGAILASGTVTGGVAELEGTGNVNNATGVITGPIDTIELGYSNASTVFARNTEGELVLSAESSSPTAFSGTIEGFTQGDAIDLPGVAYSDGGNASATFTANSGGNGGQLTVALGGTTLAVLNLVGVDPFTGLPYVTGNFNVNNDGTNSVIITDPSVAAPSVTTDSVRQHKHAANLALLGHYIASFATGENLAWGTPLGERPLTAEQPLLAHPHTG